MDTTVSINHQSSQFFEKCNFLYIFLLKKIYTHLALVPPAMEVSSRGGRRGGLCIIFPPGEIMTFVQQLLQGGKEFDTK
jgi:hypothetical protein